MSIHCATMITYAAYSGSHAPGLGYMYKGKRIDMIAQLLRTNFEVRGVRKYIYDTHATSIKKRSTRKSSRHAVHGLGKLCA
jgi:hypothetical protein